MYIDRDFVDYSTHERRRQPEPQRGSPTLFIVLVMCGIGLALALLGQ